MWHHNNDNFSNSTALIWRLASHSHPASPFSPKCHSKAHFQPETLWSHHRRAHQGGDTDVSCSAWLHTTLLGIVIHMCRWHGTPTQAQVRTTWHADLLSVNYCLSCCCSKGVEWSAKRCYGGLVAVGVQEQAEDIFPLPLLRNCLTLNDTSFS